MPSTKLRFYKQFLKKKYFQNNNKNKLKPCTSCGYLTSAGICRFCRIKETVDNKLSKTRR
jgi:recombinational DNA repair protein RecR